VNRKELSEVVAECAAITERAAARTEVARAGVEAARRRQEEAIARQEAVAARHNEYIERNERKADEIKQWTERVVAELQDQRDERRALMEALFKVMDRLDQLPPPPPHLRSA
jgi:ribosomal protein L20